MSAKNSIFARQVQTQIAMRNTFLFFFLILSAFTVQAQFSTLEQRLYELPDVLFKAIEAPDGFEAAYELHIKQPIDHENPEKGHFYQRAYLSHRSFDAPMVLATEGYMRPSNRMYELTGYLNANQVDVEHRYFGTSSPDSLDYTYLNLKQVTADLHHIRTLLGQLYTQPWVSTGISKGGQTTIFYRYFYPDDVAASVPYVAPLNLDLTDDRIYEFLANVGTEECRKGIRDVQMRVLKNRDELLPLLRWHAKGAGMEFTYLSLEKAFEYAVLEYPFSFWQLGHDCEAIPGKAADLETLLEHFVKVVGLDFYSDASMFGYASHYWQAGDEMGYYGFQTKPFKGLLKEITEEEPTAIFMPGKAPMNFDPAFVKAVYNWTQREADEMIYIYGAIDTWTATGVPVSDKVDAKWFVMEGKDHGSARIRNMSDAERMELLQTLEQWMNASKN